MLLCLVDFSSIFLAVQSAITVLQKPSFTDKFNGMLLQREGHYRKRQGREDRQKCECSDDLTDKLIAIGTDNATLNVKKIAAKPLHIETWLLFCIDS